MGSGAAPRMTVKRHIQDRPGSANLSGTAISHLKQSARAKVDRGGARSGSNVDPSRSSPKFFWEPGRMPCELPRRCFRPLAGVGRLLPGSSCELGALGVHGRVVQFLPQPFPKHQIQVDSFSLRGGHLQPSRATKALRATRGKWFGSEPRIGTEARDVFLQKAKIIIRD